VSGSPGNFSLREVETCWELGGPGFDAVKALAQIRPALLWYEGKRGWEGNAGTVTIQFSQWERLVIYAKAPDRLRFEMRHRPPKGNRPYSAPMLLGADSKLDEFRALAMGRVNELLPYLRETPAVACSENDWEAYAMAWGACCGNSEVSRAIFRLLRENGSVRGGRSVDCIAGGREMLRKARDAGLVENRYGAFRPIFPAEGGTVSLTELDKKSHNTGTQTVVSIPNSLTAIKKVRERMRIPPSPPFPFPKVAGNARPLFSTLLAV